MACSKGANGSTATPRTQLAANKLRLGEGAGRDVREACKTIRPGIRRGSGDSGEAERAGKHNEVHEKHGDIGECGGFG